jgi:hypothetical protein
LAESHFGLSNRKQIPTAPATRFFKVYFLAVNPRQSIAIVPNVEALQTSAQFGQREAKEQKLAQLIAEHNRA